jgi:hypothetical protein
MVGMLDLTTIPLCGGDSIETAVLGTRSTTRSNYDAVHNNYSSNEHENSTTQVTMGRRKQLQQSNNRVTTAITITTRSSVRKK